MTVISTSSTTPGTNTTLLQNQSLFLAPDTLLASSAGIAVITQDNNHQLDIFGTVFGTSAGIVSNTGNGTRVDIGSAGSVVSYFDAILMSGLENHIANFGEIIGSTGGIIQQVSDKFEVHNDGIISAARGYGILVTSKPDAVNAATSLIVNTGLITGENPIRYSSAIGNAFSENRLVNHGTISLLNNDSTTGPMFAIYAQSETHETVTNFGTITGDVYLGDVRDDLVNGGVIDGTVYLGSGPDTYDGRGGTVSGSVRGDVGNDLYMVDDPTIQLVEKAGEGTDEIRAAVSFALPDNFELLTLIGAEDIDGTGNNLQNDITGNAGDNALFGDGSRDVMDGGAGNDTIDGGRGDDVISGGEGNDVLSGRHGIDIIDGDAGADFLFGGIGGDIMNGGDGDDTLKGGEGPDTMTGGAGQDAFVFTRVSDSPSGASDRILGFTPGQDVLDFTGMISGQFDISILGAYTGTSPCIRTSVNTGGDTIVFVDANGDGSTDMRIELQSVAGVTESDFLL